MLLGAFRGGNPLERIVGKPSLTQIARRVGRLLGNYRQALGTAMLVIRDSYAPPLRRLSPKGWPCIQVGMANLTEISLAEAIAVLSRTPATLNALLRGLPNVWVRCNEGKDTWNAFDIMGHLIFGERTDWMPRVGIMLENGEARPFVPFDRFAPFDRKRDVS